jgi:Holliday junction resolvasome RuvABC endonuclease subunit
VLGLDLGTKLGVSRVFVDGGLDAQTIRFEGEIGSRTVGVHGVVQRFAAPDCLGVCIEEPFSGQFSSVKALFPMLGAAVLACELAGLPWSTIHISKLKIHATGKGNAKIDSTIQRFRQIKRSISDQLTVEILRGFCCRSRQD